MYKCGEKSRYCYGKTIERALQWIGQHRAIAFRGIKHEQRRMDSTFLQCAYILYKDVNAIFDIWDCSDEEKHFMAEYLHEITFDDYDRLIQLCDALSMADGYCYAEKKMVHSVIKFGLIETTLKKWKAILELKSYFTVSYTV